MLRPDIYPCDEPRVGLPPQRWRRALAAASAYGHHIRSPVGLVDTLRVPELLAGDDEQIASIRNELSSRLGDDTARQVQFGRR